MKWAHKVKILRVFESCETYAQWNNAFNWFKNSMSRTMSFEEYCLFHEAILKKFNNKKLAYTHDKTPGVCKFDN